MPSVSLTNLRARVREVADMTGSDFVSDAANSLDYFINAATDELYNLLVARDEDRFVSSESVSIVAGTDAYSLPSTFLRALRVEVLDGSRYVALRRFRLQDAAAIGDTASVLRGMRYQIRGSQLVFLPTPGASGTARLWYVPTRTALVNASDTFDFVSGWDEYVVTRAAIMVLDKEESDSSALRADLERIQRRVEESAPRDAGEVTRVVDRMSHAMDDEDLDLLR